MASDMLGEKGLIKGNAISLMLNCSSEEEVRAFMKNYLLAARQSTLWKFPSGALYMATLQISMAINGYYILIKLSNKFSMEKKKYYPVQLAAPALRVLTIKKITTLQHLARYSEKEIAALHGIGNNVLVKLKATLAQSE